MINYIGNGKSTLLALIAGFLLTAAEHASTRPVTGDLDGWSYFDI